MQVRGGKVEHWAKERGQDITFRSVVPIRSNGLDISVGYTTKGEVSVAALLEKPLSTHGTIRQRIKTSMLKARVEYTKKPPTLKLILRKLPDVGFGQIIDQAIMVLVNFILDNNQVTLSHCTYCGGEGSDEFIEKDSGVAYPVHSYCSVDSVSQLAEVRGNPATKSGRLAVLSALLGGVIAGMLTVVGLLFFEYAVTFLFMLIPLGVAVGFLMGGGADGWGFKIISLLLTVVITGISFSSFLYLFIYKVPFKYMMIAQQVVDGERTLHDAQASVPNILRYIESYPELIEKLEEAGLGGRLNIINYQKLNPLGDFFDEMSFVQYQKDFWLDSGWLRGILSELLAIGVFLVVALLISWSLVSYNRQGSDKTKITQPKENSHPSVGGGSPSLKGEVTKID